MKYRDFGDTGAKTSILGFGAMRLPTVGEGDNMRVDMDKSLPILAKGLDSGINYIDTAWGYLNKTSEEVVGEAISGRDRGELFIATKNPMDTADAKEYRKRLDLQLKKLKTDYIDFYHIHGLRWTVFQHKFGPKGHLSELRKAQEQGLIRHLSFSSHDTPDNILKIIDSGEFSGPRMNLHQSAKASESQRASMKALASIPSSRIVCAIALSTATFVPGRSGK